jgi:hypothetical protein
MTHLIGPEAAAVKGRTVQLFLAVLALTVLWLGLNAWFPWVPTTDDCPQGSAKQLHNAHYQLGEVTIRYRFHPRSAKRSLSRGAIAMATKLL